MRRCQILAELLVVPLPLLLLLGPAAAAEEEEPAVAAEAAEPEPVGDRTSVAAPEPIGDGISVAALIDALPRDYDERRLAACAESPNPQLNEICSVGVECDPDVRVGDFIELYNPAGSDVDLECFVLAGREGGPFVGRKELGAGEVRGFGESDLGFRIRKAHDAVFLFRIARAPDGGLDLLPLETLRVDAESGLSYRSPDGGSWKHLSVEEAEREWPGSFDEPNPAGLRAR